MPESQRILRDDGSPWTQPDLSRRLVRTANPRTEPRAAFVPIEVLREVPLDELPLTDSDRHWYRQRIDIRKNPERWSATFRAGQIPDCMGSEPHFDIAPELDADHVLESLQSMDTVFLGTVEEVVPGWHFPRAKVGEMVYLRVDEVLRGDLQSGAVVPEFRHGGRIQVEGVELCDQRENPFSVGDRVVAAGFPCAVEPCFDTLTVLRVEGSEAQSPHAIGEEAQRGLPLDSIRSQLATPREEIR